MRPKRYLAVFILFFSLLLLDAPVKAATESGDINVSATVRGPAPQTAPTIDYPKTGDIFGHKHIIVKGRCTPDLIVKIFSNNVFVGATICQPDGKYSLPIDLFLDRNNLIARQYDSSNQASPDSNLVVVYYIPPSLRPILPGPESELPPGVARFQLIIDYDYTVQGLFTGQPFRLPIHFGGGTPPYVVSVDWGDGSRNSFDRPNTSKFHADYTYNNPGKYIVTLKVKDSHGQEAYLQFVVLVNGKQQINKIFGQEISQDLTNLIALIAVILMCAALLVGVLFEKIRAARRKKAQPKDSTIDNQP